MIFILNSNVTFNSTVKANQLATSQSALFAPAQSIGVSHSPSPSFSTDTSALFGNIGAKQVRKGFRSDKTAAKMVTSCHLQQPQKPNYRPLVQEILTSET